MSAASFATHVRPRRSVLYMPGARARALEKARSLPCDALIFDLEDAVAPDEKPAARRAVCAALEQGGYGRRECVIRVNGLDTPWGREDLIEAAKAGPDAVLLPKLEQPSQIDQARAILNGADDTKQIALWAMIETPLGVLRAPDLAAHSEKLEAFVVGANDLAKDLRADDSPPRTALLASLSMIVLAARAHGLAAIDAVHNAYEDLEGFKAACAHSKMLGFEGRTLIHPKQIEPANQVFAPTEAELDLARRRVAAHQEALAKGEAVAVVDGKIVEGLHVEAAMRLLQFSEAIRA